MHQEIYAIEHDDQSIIEESRTTASRATPLQRWESERGPFTYHYGTRQSEEIQTSQKPRQTTPDPRLPWHDLSESEYLMVGIGKGMVEIGGYESSPSVEEAMVDHGEKIVGKIRRSWDFDPEQPRVSRPIRLRKQPLPEG